MNDKPCGLIPRIPPALEAEWAEKLAGLVERFQPAALILSASDADSAAKLIAGAKALDLAVLFTDQAEKARVAGANGIYLTIPGTDLSKVRTTLGVDSIIGAACGLSRHAAMESAEAGADFVAFDASSREKLDEAAELSLWWDEITGVPVALSCATERPARSALSKARPDFLIIEEAGHAGESLTFATEFGLQSQG